MRVFLARIRVNRFPLADALLWQRASAKEVVINMIESLSPSWEVLLRRGDDLLAEAAPELSIAVATQTTLVLPILNGLDIVHSMVLLEM